MQAMQRRHAGFRRLGLPETWEIPGRVTGYFFIEVIDAQHRELDHLLMQLGNLIRTRCAKPIISQALSDFAELTLEHFEDEEKILDAIGYPRLQEHREAHHLFMEDVRHSANQYGLSSELTGAELLEILCGQMTTHMLVWDSDYGSYIDGIASFPTEQYPS